MNFTDKNIVREEDGFPLCGGTATEGLHTLTMFFYYNIINFNGVEREK